MTLASDLAEIVAELDRIHPNGRLELRAHGADRCPVLRTAASGGSRRFSQRAVNTMERVSHTIYTNQPSLREVLRFEQFFELVGDCVTECHVLLEFAHSQSPGSNVEALKARIATALKSLQTNFTHFFPAWTSGIETELPFAIGPVTFLTKEAWLGSVDFADFLKGQEHLWRANVKAALDGDLAQAELTALEKMVFEAVRECPSLLAITIGGSEMTLSRQQARFACKAALDALALLFDRNDLHARFVLQDDRNRPDQEATLVAVDGLIPTIGSALNFRGWISDPAKVRDTLARSVPLIQSSGQAIGALLTPISHPAPDLAKRWLTALAWFGDGCRELNDAVALTKIATSLDVLSAGGKKAGILQMLTSLVGMPPDEVVVGFPRKTLNALVSEIYGYGRSQLLHGTHVDPMKSFSDERTYATTITKMALRQAVLKWSAYSGPDESDAFRTMG